MVISGTKVGGKEEKEPGTDCAHLLPDYGSLLASMWSN